MKKINDICIAAALKFKEVQRNVKHKLEDSKGQFAMDNGVAMVICVALGAIILTLLILYFKGEFSTNVKNNIADFFSQS